jgi:hypothetical protein
LPAKSVKVRIPLQEKAFRQEIKKNIFPTIYDDEDFFLDKNLKPIRVISIQKKELLTEKKINILFELMIEAFKADVFMILNGQKTDLYYSITSGKYSFRNILLKTGKNVLEIFYRVQMSKSPSIFVQQTVK